MTGHTVEIKKGYRWNPVKKKLEKVTTFRAGIKRRVDEARTAREAEQWKGKGK